MKIKELQAKQGNVEIEAEVISMEEPKEFQKFGTVGRVSNAIIEDETGQIKLTLWNDQIDQVKVGDKVKISKGYVNEYKGDKQLTTGKFGKLEVIGSESTGETKTAKKPETKKEEKKEEKEATEENFDEDVEDEDLDEDVNDEDLV